jgi:diguanylate cyclase (GGDEF)-like protein
MAELEPIFLASEPDPSVLEKLAVTEQLALETVIALAILNLACSFLPLAQRLETTNWRLMSGEAVLFALMSALSLLLLEPRRSQRRQFASEALAAAVLLLSGIIVAGRVLHSAPGAIAPVSSLAQSYWILSTHISLSAAGGFALLGLSMLSLRARSRAAVLAADLSTCCLVFAVLVCAAEQISDMSHIFGPAADTGRSLQTTVCLLLLTSVTFFHRARKGILSIFVGCGTGSKLARAMSPILLMLPYLREWGRAHLIGGRRMPPPYTTAILATMVVIVSTALLLYLARRINGMEVEIHSLSLRDELTGLYNLRGFRLLAEQGLRRANRSSHPFSVLFVDLDDLKQVNDQFGHFVGSQCLVETAEILRTVFREADVLGRIGGDEFAVAGEFTEPGMVAAVERLGEIVAGRNTEPDRPIQLSLSFGTVTSKTGSHETLDALLKSADHAMYEQKRRKKGLVGEIVQS